MKAQASLEQLVVIATALAFVSAAFYLAAVYSSDSVRISQAQDAVDRLASAVDYVYALGPNTREYVTVFLPQDLQIVNVSGKRIVFRVSTSAGETDVFANTRADLVGALPAFRGKQKILVEYLASGKVSIGEAGLSCSPSLITRSFDAGGSGSDELLISNYAAYEVTGITAALSGATMLASITSPPGELSVGGNGTLTLDYSIPENQPSGIYGALVTVESGNDGSCVAQITIQVNGQSSCAALCAGQGYSTGACRDAPSSCVANGEDYADGNDYACAGNGTPYCCCYPTADVWGPLVSSINSTPANASAGTAITINAACNDTTTGMGYISSAEVQIDGGAFAAASASDGAFSSSVVEHVYRNVGTLSAGQHIAGVRCTDTANNTGPISYYYFNITMADVLGPIITSLTHSDPFPTTLANISEYGNASEEFTGGANISMCYLRLDSGDWAEAEPSDGAYDSTIEGFFLNIGQLETGMHTVYAYCTDGLGNAGGIANDTFGVSTVDVVLIMDRSGSMSETVTNAENNNAVSTSSSSFVWVKSVTLSTLNGQKANISAEIRTGSWGATVAFEARVGSDVLANGTRTSTSYGTITREVNISAYSLPITVDLYLRRSGGSGTVYNRNFIVRQQPTKMRAAQDSAKTFVDIVSNSTLASLVSYSTSASTDLQLTGMESSSNRTTLKNAIEALVASGNTCIECGLDNAVAELISARGRYPEAVRVAILLTDGQGNVGDSIDGATNARENNVIVYTIGFGDDVDETELTNIALLTGGEYYYAPDAATLLYIYQHIGQ